MSVKIDNVIGLNELHQRWKNRSERCRGRTRVSIVSYCLPRHKEEQLHASVSELFAFSCIGEMHCEYTCYRIYPHEIRR